MLLPKDINPEFSIYYNGAVILEQLNKKHNIDIMSLFKKIKEEHGMSLSTYMLSLDWLFLSNIAVVNERGEIELCS